MTLYCNGIKVCPTITINGGGDIDHGGAYLIKVIDYDGTVLKQDHLNTGDTFELPEPPTNHERLTFQTWSSPLQITNNTITVGKSDVTIGAVYTTKSGKNEFVIELNATTGKTVQMRPQNTSVSIDWGDGTSTTGTSSFVDHTYNDYGTYIISISGMVAISTYFTPYKGVHLASSYYTYPLVNSLYLDYLTLSNDTASTGFVQINLAYNLKTFIIPPSVTSLFSLVASGTNIENLVIPYGFTSTGSRPIVASNCALEKVTIPSTVTSIYQILYNGSDVNNYVLKEINFTEHTSVPSLTNTNTFLNPRLKIRVPKSLESQWKSATNWSVYADYIVGVE